MRFARLTYLFSCLLFLGCKPDPNPALPQAATDVMRNADSYELFSLELVDNQKPAGELFQSYSVRGKCPVAVQKDREWITANIERGLAEPPTKRTYRWSQVYGVRAKRGESVVELLFDFDANNLTVYWDGLNRSYPTSTHVWWLIQKKLFDAGVQHP